MSEFDKWWEYHRDAKDSLNFHDAKYVYESQQDKIDELQARIDDALNTLCKLQCSSGERIYNDVGNILKANKDD